MSQPEFIDVPDPIRTLTFDDVARNVRMVEVGDRVEVPDFRKQFDPLAITLANLSINPLFSGFENGEDASRSLESRLIGAVAVQRIVGLTPAGKEKYHGWPTTTRLPSEAIKPPRHYGDIRNAAITLLGKSTVRIPGESVIRSVDMLLQGDVYSSRAGIIAHPAARLEVQKRGMNKPKVTLTKLSGEDAEAIVAAMHAESRETSYKVAVRARRHPFAGGAFGQGKDQR